MAASPTINDKIRIVLDVYKHFHVRAGELLSSDTLSSRGEAQSSDASGMDVGLAAGIAQGLLEPGPSGCYRLTQAGFDVMWSPGFTRRSSARRQALSETWATPDDGRPHLPQRALEPV